MKLLELAAWSKEAAELTVSEVAEIAQTGLVDVVAGSTAGEFRLVTNSRVGVASGDGWELRVRPKLAIPRLFFLIAYARDPNGWKDQSAFFEGADDLVDAIASGFAWQALNAVEGGLLRGYVEVEDRIPTIRGRLRFADQIARNATLPIPAEVAYDEYTEDILENRILKTATLLLLRLPRVPEKTRHRLLRLRSLLGYVSVIDRPRDTRFPLMTRLNQNYGHALRLAELIFQSASFDAARGEFAATAFAFDMNKVFEDFVTTALSEAFEQHGGSLRAQFDRLSLDFAERLNLRPDLTWWVDGDCRAIIDAKYKAIDEGVMRNGDAYQMLAYCTAFNLSRGYLVYARDSGQEPRVHVIRHSGHEIHVEAIDVEKPPADVLAAIAGFAARLAEATPASVAAAAA